MKTCSKCKASLDESAFPKNRSEKDGLHQWCKECKNSARRKGKRIVPDEQMRARYRKMRVNGKNVDVHRYVAEQTIGRPLEADEVVHHINGNKLDNRPENLRVMTAGEHSSMEAKNMSPDIRERINLKNTGHKASQETRNKQSEVQKRLWRDGLRSLDSTIPMIQARRQGKGGRKKASQPN